MSNTSSSALQPPDSDDIVKDLRLPSLFAIDTHLIGWQGLTSTTPANWNIALFGGDHKSGHLRIDDEDGPRLELRWENPTKIIDIQRSVDDFLGRIGRQLKKQKENFTIVEDKRIVARSRPITARRKDGLVHFGWTGERSSVLGQGWGAAWICPDCGRVVVAHVIGRGAERPEKAQRLAGEILASTSCHGKGGWQTWSIFDLSIDVPEDFVLARAKLLTGRLDLEWTRAQQDAGIFTLLFKSLRRDERLTLTRWSLAEMILSHETLFEWARRTLTLGDKTILWRGWDAATVREHDAVLARGTMRDLRRRAIFKVQNRLRPANTYKTDLRVWHCPPSNKIFGVSNDLKPQNEHVVQDVLDSLECH